MRLPAIIAAALICASSAALAQMTPPAEQKPAPAAEKLDPINPDRPDFTNSPDTVAKGHAQVEAGILCTRSGTLKLTEIGDGATLRIGTTKRFEWRLNLPSYAFSDDVGGNSRGFENGGLGFKAKLADASEKFSWGHPKIGFEGDVTLPTGSPGFRENNVQPFGHLLIEWDFDANNQLGVSLGLGEPSQGDERFTQGFAAASFGHQVSQTLGVFLESFGFFPGSPHGPNLPGFDGGVQILVSNDVMLDARLGVVLADPKPNYVLGAGISIRW